MTVGPGTIIRPLIAAVAVILLAVAVAALETRYVFQQFDGALIRIDRFIGTAVRMEGVAPKEKPAVTRPLRILGDVKLPKGVGNTTMTASTKWIAGKMLYRLVTKTYTDDMKKARFPETPVPDAFIWRAEFDDDDGFTVAEERIPVSKFTSVTSDNNKVNNLEYQGSIDMDVNTYDRIVTWNCGWAGLWTK